MAAVKLLFKFINMKVARIRRVFFTRHGMVDEAFGPLEFEFECGSVLHLFADGAIGGLAVRDQAWRDPLETFLPDQRERVSSDGKWSVLDVSAQPAYRPYVGAALSSIRLLRVETGDICGARLRFGTLLLDFVASGDRSFVVVDRDDPRLASLRIVIGDEISRAE